MPDAPDSARSVSLGRVEILKALRLSGLLVTGVSLALAWLWWDSFVLPREVVLPYILCCLGFLVVWVQVYKQPMRLRLVLAPFAGLGAVGVAGHYGVMWGRVMVTSRFNVTPLLCLCVGTIGLGMAAVADIVLRGKRDRQGVSRDSDKPAEMEMGPAVRRPPIHWGKRVALHLPAALLIGLLVVSILPWPTPPPAPARHVTAEAPAALPALPSRVGTTSPWALEMTGLLSIDPGAAGPIVLTTNGISALNPRDGATRWSWHRAGSMYLRLGSKTGLFNREEALARDYMVTSPDGRYVAVRYSPVPQPRRPYERRDEEPPAVMLVVLDAVTGRVVMERPSKDSDTLQLSNSVVMDDRTGYSLADGAVLWERPPFSYETYTGYSGPVGAHSFIHSVGRENGDRSILVAPDTDPTKTTRVNRIAWDPMTEEEVVVMGGWTIQFTVPTAEIWINPADRDNDNIVSRDAQAVSLDALAGVADAQPVPVGLTPGVNARASFSANALAAYPRYVGGEDKQDLTLHDEHVPVVGLVFDPASGTLLRPENNPGPSAARVGIASTPDGNNITVLPADGSTKVTVAVDPGALLTARKPPNQPQQMGWSSQYLVSLVNTPGVTLLALQAAPREWTGTANGSYRVYGIPGGAS